MKTIYGSQENWKAVENEFEESSNTLICECLKALRELGVKISQICTKLWTSLILKRLQVHNLIRYIRKAI